MKLIDELTPIVRLPLRGLIWLTGAITVCALLLLAWVTIGWLFKTFPGVMWTLVGIPFVMLFLGWIGSLVEDKYI